MMEDFVSRLFIGAAVAVVVRGGPHLVEAGRGCACAPPVRDPVSELDINAMIDGKAEHVADDDEHAEYICETLQDALMSPMERIPAEYYCEM